MLVLFLCLIVGPIVGARFLSLDGMDIPMDLMQPTGQNHNDTSSSQTGTGAAGGSEPTDDSSKLMFYL